MYKVVPSQVLSYLDSRFPPYERKEIGSEQSPAVRFLLALIDSMPVGVVTLQGDALAEFGEAVESIRVAVDSWNRGGKHSLGKVPGRDKAHALSLLRKHLETLRDDVLTPAPATLSFIPDEKLRESLRQDISAAHRSLQASDWKGCTVVAGSVVEALLLWGIEAKTVDAGPDLNTLTAQQLTEKARSLKLVSHSTKQQCQITKEFRDLIHPGRTKRLEQRCNLGTALSALAAIEHVIGDLERAFGQAQR